MTGPPLDRLSELVEAATAVAGAAELTKTLETIVETAMELTDARYGALGVIGEHGFLTEFIHRGIDQETVSAIGQLPTGRGLLGTITRTQGPVRVDHIPEHEDATGFPAHHPTMDSFLGMPIRVGDELFGNLYLTDKEGGFTQEDEDLVQALAKISGSALATANRQRRLTSVAVIEDRERIARDLHDAIIQDLFAVGLSLQATSKHEAAADVQQDLMEAASRLDDAITALRRFIFDLRPPVWGQRQLRVELGELLAQLAEPHSVVLEISYSGEVDNLPDRLIDEILQCTRESVSNALRHASASLITVLVSRNAHRLELITVDDGVGFEVDSANPGMGLDNLRRRSADLGGHAEITSELGSGTTVVVRLPL